jgi:hypothetical protein
VLDILKKQNIKATFFVVGENVKQYPEIIKRISEEGHIIGNHSYSHPKTSTLDNGEISMQMAFTNKAIKEVLGFQPKYYRTPFTSFGGYTVKNHLINLTSAEQNNLIIQEVDVNSSDWLVESDIDIINSVLTNIQNESSSQILFHDSGGNRSPTVKALPIIIDRIIKNKYRIENSALASEKNILESNTNYKENLHTNIISYGVFIQKYIVHLTTLALSVEIIKVFVGFSLFYKHGHKKKEEENMSSDFTYPRCFNYCSWI